MRECHLSTWTITYVHPDLERWNQFLEAHLRWIEQRLDDGSIIASGPLPDELLLSALIIMDARDRTHVDQLLAGDPFMAEGLVTQLTVRRWEPIFGMLADKAG